MSGISVISARKPTKVSRPKRTYTLVEMQTAAAMKAEGKKYIEIAKAIGAPSAKAADSLLRRYKATQAKIAVTNLGATNAA